MHSFRIVKLFYSLCSKILVLKNISVKKREIITHNKSGVMVQLQVLEERLALVQDLVPLLVLVLVVLALAQEEQVTVLD